MANIIQLISEMDPLDVLSQIMVKHIVYRSYLLDLEPFSIESTWRARADHDVSMTQAASEDDYTRFTQLESELILVWVLS